VSFFTIFVLPISFTLWILEVPPHHTFSRLSEPSFCCLALSLAYIRVLSDPLTESPLSLLFYSTTLTFFLRLPLDTFQFPSLCTTRLPSFFFVLFYRTSPAPFASSISPLVCLLTLRIPPLVVHVSQQFFSILSLRIS